MSPTSYQLLYPAVLSRKYIGFLRIIQIYLAIFVRKRTKT